MFDYDSEAGSQEGTQTDDQSSHQATTEERK